MNGRYPVMFTNCSLFLFILKHLSAVNIFYHAKNNLDKME